MVSHQAKGLAQDNLAATDILEDPLPTRKLENGTETPNLLNESIELFRCSRVIKPGFEKSLLLLPY